MVTLGILTLGQAPRTDIEPTFRAILGDRIAFMQRGALDGLGDGECARLGPEAGESGIETCLRKRDGVVRGVLVAKRLLLPRLIAAGRKLEAECDALVLLCSGRFPELKRAIPRLIEPITVIRSVVAALAGQGHLCVIGPASDMDAAPAQWRSYAARVSTAAASPYGGQETLVRAALRARTAGADYVLLDDMGFTEPQRRTVRDASGLPTLSATSITARIFQELV
ncbi:AroM family protein [Solidesulfovibrio sp.]|uniref:AroM family protein n=1 Tax=Solidesulfovibrio sp. TaxID=2910990 RepID=UPI002B219AF2|nr:AroM family protein [Solidesulfovibrio sp.]MEA5088589.1 AroM family protein [Solidesulfovibrio sp.]HML59490.1 AroM family protein [Solidesulfovibrio sp.]